MWRNFSRQTEIHLGGWAFLVGPNASGNLTFSTPSAFYVTVREEGSKAPLQ